MTEAQWLASTDPERMLAFLTGPIVELHTLAGQMQRPTDRQLRLFCVACCRAVWHMLPEESQLAVQAAERHADGKATEQEVTYRHLAAHLDMEAGERERRYPAESLARLASWSTQIPEATARLIREKHAPPGAVQADILRDLFGNPWRSVTVDRREHCSCADYYGNPCRWCPDCHGQGSRLIRPDWLAWQGGVISRMAEKIYADRDWVAMPVLHDALCDAGCTDEQILNHCRGQEPCASCNGLGYVLPQRTYCYPCNGTGSRPAVHARGCHIVDILRGKS